MARRLWPGQSAVGRTALAGGTEAEVIGVIAEVLESSAEENAGEQMYLPANKQFGPEGEYLVLRSMLPATALAQSVMLTLRRINPGQPATEFKPMQALVDHSTSPRKFFVLLVGVFASLGLLLASLGIYVRLAAMVSFRRHRGVFGHFAPDCIYPFQVQDGSFRSAHLHRNDRCAWDGGADGRLSPSTKSFKDQSNHCAPVELNYACDRWHSCKGRHCRVDPSSARRPSSISAQEVFSLRTPV